MPDTPGPVATGRDTRFSLSIDDAVALYARAGHPRTTRSVQRYCAAGHLDCVKETTLLGDKYFIDAESVSRHIAQIEELIALDRRTSGRDLSRPGATIVAHHSQANSEDQARRTESHPVAVHPSEIASKIGLDNARHITTGPIDPSRQDATGRAASSDQVAQLEKRIDEKDEVITLLKGQLTAKDQQITDLSTRFGNLSDRFADTQKLLGAMQRMFAPLLGQGDPYDAPPERRDAADQSASS
jgi:uncharacterized coiled-coil protein SlyX